MENSVCFVARVQKLTPQKIVNNEHITLGKAHLRDMRFEKVHNSKIDIFFALALIRKGISRDRVQVKWLEVLTGLDISHYNGRFKDDEIRRGSLA